MGRGAQGSTESVASLFCCNTDLADGLDIDVATTLMGVAGRRGGLHMRLRLRCGQCRCIPLAGMVPRIAQLADGYSCHMSGLGSAAADSLSHDAGRWQCEGRRCPFAKRTF